MKYVTDGKRHLVCEPYSRDNLRKMAEDLNLNKHWFHKNHYDIPLRRKAEIEDKCEIVSTKEIIRIINSNK